MANFNELMESEDQFDEDSYGIITLTLDDDSELDCAILSIYPVGDKQYIALMPLDEEGDVSEEAEVLIYRFVEHEDADPDLENIDDDDEYEAAADAFDELLDAEEFDEDFEDEDEKK